MNEQKEGKLRLLGSITVVIVFSVLYSFLQALNSIFKNFVSIILFFSKGTGNKTHKDDGDGLVMAECSKLVLVNCTYVSII